MQANELSPGRRCDLRGAPHDVLTLGVARQGHHDALAGRPRHGGRRRRRQVVILEPTDGQGAQSLEVLAGEVAAEGALGHIGRHDAVLR